MMVIKNNKLLLKILSGFIAIVLWFAITYTEDPAVNQHLTNINAVFSGETQLRERGLTVIDKDELPVFSAVIRGNRSNVISSLGVVSALIDVSEITEPGTHDVVVEYRYPKESVILTKAKVSSVSVKVEKILSRNIPVKLEGNVGEKDPDRLISSQLVTDKVTIRGAQSTVERISYASALVNSSEISANGSMEYVYKLYDYENNLINEKNIISKSPSSVIVSNTIYKKAELPVEVVLSDALAENFILKLKKQSVSKLVVGLADEDAPSSVKAVIDDADENPEGAKELELTLPDNVYYAGDTPTVSVEYELIAKTAHELHVSVKPENVPEGKTVTITPDTIRVKVKCTEDDASSNKISATIDAGQLSEGKEQSISVTIKAEDNIEVIGTYSVMATLQ